MKARKMIELVIFAALWNSFAFAQQSFWSQLNISLNERIYAMTVTRQGTIVVGTLNGVYCSDDTGQTWVARKSGLPAGYGALAADDEGTIYAGIYGAGMYSIHLSDTAWTALNSGLTYKNITAVAVLPEKKTLYAGTRNSGSFIRHDGDTSWSPMDQSLSDAHIECFLVDTVAHHLFAGTWSGVFRSSDEGAFWERVGSTTTFIITTMAVNSQGVLFAGSSNYGIFRSTDNGQNWEPKNTAMFDSLVSNLVVNAADIVYTSTSMGVFYSTNNGDSWIQISGISGQVQYLTFDADNYLYAGTQNGNVYRSKSATATGVAEETGGAFRSCALFQNYPNPFNPATILPFSIRFDAMVTLKVYDVLGREVTVVLREYRHAGYHEVRFDASALPAGMYFYRMTAGRFSAVKRFVLIK